jgi:hypothetical protein
MGHNSIGALVGEVNASLGTVDFLNQNVSTFVFIYQTTADTLFSEGTTDRIAFDLREVPGLTPGIGSRSPIFC